MTEAVIAFIYKVLSKVKRKLDSIYEKLLARKKTQVKKYTEFRKHIRLTNWTTSTISV